MKKNILVTGGCGYIASHFISILDPEEYEIIIIDNLSRSNIKVIKNLKKITKIKIYFYNIDLLDVEKLKKIFISHAIDSVAHFAGYKSVSESLINPLSYYQNNLKGTINLVNLLLKNNIKKIIFSSSATLYGNSKKQPVTELSVINPISPYGKIKYMIENLLQDICFSKNDFTATSLRYFNPVGAHKSGFIGEPVTHFSGNLMPSILMATINPKMKLKIFGNDYPTPDGTCLRDFIHVDDLAKAHLSALDFNDINQGFNVFNIGTGKPTSVFELIKTFEITNSIQIPFEFVSRRVGDVPISYANVRKANKYLKWHAQLSIEDICFDSWNWFSGIDKY